MNKHKTLSVTSVPESPEAERRRRMSQYAIAMTIRTLCVIALVILPSPWLWFAAVGAVFLPYFAVVVANAHETREGTSPEPVNKQIS